MLAACGKAVLRSVWVWDGRSRGKSWPGSGSTVEMLMLPYCIRLLTRLRQILGRPISTWGLYASKKLLTCTDNVFTFACIIRAWKANK